MNVDNHPDKTYKVVNAYDELVRQAVHEAIDKDDGMCKCEKCFLDVCTIVFNSGFSHFVTSHQGELYAKVNDMNLGNHVDLFIVVLRAIQTVKQKPMH